MIYNDEYKKTLLCNYLLRVFKIKFGKKKWKSENFSSKFDLNFFLKMKVEILFFES